MLPEIHTSSQVFHTEISDYKAMATEYETEGFYKGSMMKEMNHTSQEFDITFMTQARQTSTNSRCNFKIENFNQTFNNKSFYNESQTSTFRGQQKIGSPYSRRKGRAEMFEPIPLDRRKFKRTSIASI